MPNNAVVKTVNVILTDAHAVAVAVTESKLTARLILQRMSKNRKSNKEVEKA